MCEYFDLIVTFCGDLDCWKRAKLVNMRPVDSGYNRLGLLWPHA